MNYKNKDSQHHIFACGGNLQQRHILCDTGSATHHRGTGAVDIGEENKDCSVDEQT